MIVNTRGARVGSRRVGRRLLVCVCAVVLLAACNGDDDAVSSSAPPVTPVTIAPTTVATTSDPPTTPVAQTDPPTTTASSTSATTATAPPVPTTDAATSSTTPELADDEERVRALIDGQYAAWRECVRSIPSCDTANFDDFLVDPQLTGDRQTIAEWQANFYEAEDVDTLTFEILEIDLAFTIPYAVVCQRDAGSLFQRRPDEPERLVEGGYVEKIREVHLRRTPDGWRIEGFYTRDEVVGQEGALCS